MNKTIKADKEYTQTNMYVREGPECQTHIVVIVRVMKYDEYYYLSTVEEQNAEFIDTDTNTTQQITTHDSKKKMGTTCISVRYIFELEEQKRSKKINKM